MPAMQDTAYPRLKATVSERELRDLYTPTWGERDLAERSANGMVARVAFLCLLKTHQRLGYLIPLTAVPRQIVEHIAALVGQPVTTADLLSYDASGTRRRHLSIIRNQLQLHRFDQAGQRAMEAAMTEAALTKDDVMDLINIALEELVRLNFELPAYSAFERTAARIRSAVNHTFYDQIAAALSEADQQQIDALFMVDPLTHTSAWNDLKAEPGKASLTHLKEDLERLAWLKERQIGTQAVTRVPDVKVKRFATEAQALDAARMQAMQLRKRYALAACLLATRYAQALDDLAEMSIKRLLKLHQQGKEAFEAYRREQHDRVDHLIETLRDVTWAYRGEGSYEERLAAIDAAFGGQSAKVLEACEQHLAVVGNTYFPFLSRFYGSHRATLFKFLRAVTLRSVHQDTALEATIAFLLANEQRTGEWLPICEVTQQGRRNAPPQLKPLVDLSWMSDVWWRVVSGQRKRTPLPRRVKRQLFELAVFTQILWDLKTGDLSIEGSDLYANTWAQGISWEEYQQSVGEYGQMLGFPVEGKEFATHLQAWLATIAQEVDAAFPRSQVTIEQGEPVIHRPAKQAVPPGLAALEQLLAERLEPISVLDMLADVEFWLRWCEVFGPLSGFETKLDDAVERYLITVFAFGTQLGPAQTARSLPTIDRRQIAWIHQHHISEEDLDRANTRVIDAYARFELPKRWGNAKRASADGTKWEIHVQNLLAEYHIRYGGYGGIGFYHVSDTYIALCVLARMNQMSS